LKQDKDKSSSRDAAAEDLAGLLARVAGGDRASFESLYQRTAPKLLAAARRILSESSVAEDAVQEAYVRIWSRAADFDPAIASPMAWMATITRHIAIDIVRRGASRVSAASVGLEGDLVERLADPSTGGDRLLAGAELASCLKALEEDRRSMVLLAYCQGWSREELSERFARPAATIKTLLRRSLIALKECLGAAR
jgi:RNA polymerase sigma-70 factor (ECF subfamily)